MDCLRRAVVLSDCRLKDAGLRWPRDAHGDGLRRLYANGFDFSKPAVIDFRIYFEAWPAHTDAMLRLCREYSSVSSCGTDDECGGFLEFQVYALLTYELVTGTTDYVTELMSPYRGACLSWGVEFARSQQDEGFSLEAAGGSNLAHSL